MIKYMINQMNMNKKIKLSKTSYSKFKLRILEHLKFKGTVKDYMVNAEQTVINIQLNNFNKIKLIEPYNLGYTIKQLVQIKTHLDKLYGGYIVVNTNRGLINEAKYGGKILFYVY